MKGDFTRDTFDPTKHFSRVLMQQGRVLLDPDWNEQTSILLHYMRMLATHLIGPHGGPSDDLGFEITWDDNGLKIGPGCYYVDGVCCENRPADGVPIAYADQPNYSKDLEVNLEGDKTYLAYLDVWERHISWVEDWKHSEPGIREVALGGPDTCTRAKVVWQVKATPWQNGTCPDDLADVLVSKERGKLKARAKADPATAGDDPCTVEPDARYRGAENQLYRVEIHRGGQAWAGNSNNKDEAATFKWSRENGSVVFPLASPPGMTVTVEKLGSDGDLRLKVGDWVEFVDDDITLGDGSGPLFLVDAIDPLEGRVALKAPDDASDFEMPEYERPQDKHALLRRWDQIQGEPDHFSGGAILITESSGDNDEDWLHLEDGVQIQFPPLENGDARREYRPGDYWLIPARTATRDVEWPGTIADPLAVPPHGVDHHYAPLATIKLSDDGSVTPTDCRKSFAACAM